jgi:hypothetical protein
LTGPGPSTRSDAAAPCGVDHKRPHRTAAVRVLTTPAPAREQAGPASSSELETENRTMTSSVLSIVPPPEPPVEAAQTAQVMRSARALIGWMRPDDAARIVQSGRADAAPEAALEIAQRARNAAAARPAEIDQGNLITSLPAELDEHARALRASPPAAPMWAEGWQVALVDLRRVRAFQPIVLSDQATDRVAAVDGNDLASIASVTLPLTQGEPVPVQFDPIKQAWTVISANQNLRVLGNLGPMAVSPGGIGLGFVVVRWPSFMQVGCYRGRHFLRDGYHRAFGLLSRGISVVPAFVRDITAFEELLPDPRAMLPQDSYRGSRPPVLPDYLEKTVSAAVQVPAQHKMVIIQALELTPVG